MPLRLVDRKRHGWTGSITGPLIVLYGTVVALLFGFFVYHGQSLVASPIDVNGFGLISRNIALGHGFSEGYGDTIRRAPLYPAFGALILKIFGQYSPGTPDAVTYRPLLAVQSFIFGLTCLLAWATARRLFGARVALVAALVCPLIPQSIRYVGQTEVETLMGFLIALLAYTGLRLVERPSILTGAAFGLTAAAATLTKPVTQLYPFFFVALLLGVWSADRVRRTPNQTRLQPRAYLSALAAMFAFFVLPLAPWLVRDWVVTNGQFVGISSNAPGEALRGYVAVQPKYVLLRQDFGDWDAEANDFEEALLQRYQVPFYHWNDPENGAVVVSPPIPPAVSSAMLSAQKDHLESTELKERILHDPAEFLRKSVVQIATFWYLVVDRKQSLLVGSIALVVLALAIAGTWRASRQGAPAWPVVAILVYLNVVYAGTLAMARYSMPLYPTLLVLAAGGLVAIVSDLANSLWRIQLPNTRASAVKAKAATRHSSLDNELAQGVGGGLSR